MCGRSVYVFTDKDAKEDPSLGITDVQSEFQPNYNVAPTDQIPVVLPGSRILSTYRWGLIPYWAKDKNIGASLINARSETLLEKPSFKDSLKTRRCLVLSSGFFEWNKKEGKKIPHYFQVKNKNIIAYAGLWDEWSDKVTNQKIRTCTIITCEPNALVKNFHDRMPVILKEQDYETWLTSTDFKEYRSLLIPISETSMTEYEVSTDINSTRNNNKELLEPIEREGDSKQQTLF